MNKRTPVLLRALTVKPDPALACALLLLSETTGIPPQKLFKAKVQEVVGLRPFVRPLTPALEQTLQAVATYVALNQENTKKLFLEASKKQIPPNAEDIKKGLTATTKTRAMLESVLGEMLIDTATLNELDDVFTALEQALAKTAESKTPETPNDPVMVKLKRREAEALIRLLTRFALDR